MKKEDSRVFFFQMGGGGFEDVADSSVNPDVPESSNADSDANDSKMPDGLKLLVTQWKELSTSIQAVILILAERDITTSISNNKSEKKSDSRWSDTVRDILMRWSWFNIPYKKTLRLLQGQRPHDQSKAICCRSVELAKLIISFLG